MVQAIINVDEHTNRILNVIKAKFGLRDKSEAINMMAMQYEANILEPELRPEYLNRLNDMVKEKGKRFNSVEDLKNEIKNV